MRGRSLRSQAITDLVYHDGKLFIAGLCNEEFSSTLRVTPFPLQDDESATSLEIYHTAHQRYETNAQIRTFLNSALPFGKAKSTTERFVCANLWHNHKYLELYL